MNLFPNFQEVFLSIFGCLGTSIVSFVNFIISQPYLLIGLVLMLIGVAVSFLKRLIRV